MRRTDLPHPSPRSRALARRGGGTTYLSELWGATDTRGQPRQYLFAAAVLRRNSIFSLLALFISIHLHGFGCCDADHASVCPRPGSLAGGCTQEARCVAFSGANVDAAVARQLLCVVQPAAIEAAIMATKILRFWMPCGAISMLQYALEAHPFEQSNRESSHSKVYELTSGPIRKLTTWTSPEVCCAKMPCGQRKSREGPQLPGFQSRSSMSHGPRGVRGAATPHSVEENRRASSPAHYVDRAAA